MKKIVAILLTLCVMLLCLPAVSADVPITVFLDNEPISFDAEPMIVNDRTMVPMRAIFESLGATVSWDEDTRCASAEKDGVTVRLIIDRYVMYRNGEAFMLDASPIISEDRTLVPLRAVSEAFGAEVRWNGALRRVDIYTTSADVVFREELLISQLSKEDEAYFKSRFSEVCYDYLGYSYPATFLSDPELAYESILAKDADFADALMTTWNETVMYYIMLCQVYSETIIYQPPHNITDDQYYDIYLNLTRELGYDAEHMIKSSYTTLSDGTPILLLSFLSDDCVAKYACIAAKDNSVRYFAATTDTDNALPMLLEEIVLYENIFADEPIFDYLLCDDSVTDEASFLESVQLALTE